MRGKVSHCGMIGLGLTLGDLLPLSASINLLIDTTYSFANLLSWNIALETIGELFTSEMGCFLKSITTHSQILVLDMSCSWL